MKILQQGAEAIIQLNEDVVTKNRVSKSYRDPSLDKKIRKHRTKIETNIISKASRLGISVPRIIDNSDFEIKMEYVDGDRLKDFLSSFSESKINQVAEKIGKAVAKLHNSGIIHGDLTTSNMILKADSLYLIDFGLAKNSNKIEDQAVDLFLLFEALKAGHFPILDQTWHGVLKAYKRNYFNSNKVLNQIESIKKRRRYK